MMTPRQVDKMAAWILLLSFIVIGAGLFLTGKLEFLLFKGQ